MLVLVFVFMLVLVFDSCYTTFEPEFTFMGARFVRVRECARGWVGARSKGVVTDAYLESFSSYFV